jgi:hypothetical protein
VSRGRISWKTFLVKEPVPCTTVARGDTLHLGYPRPQEATLQRPEAHPPPGLFLAILGYVHPEASDVEEKARHEI